MIDVSGTIFDGKFNSHLVINDNIHLCAAVVDVRCVDCAMVDETDAYEAAITYKGGEGLTICAYGFTDYLWVCWLVMMLYRSYDLKYWEDIPAP